MPKIVINPEVFHDNREALAVAWNEALRIFMEENDFNPQFEVTDKQREFFADTAYANDEVMLRRTIVARIITHDTSVSDITPEQNASCRALLESILKAYKGPDTEMVRVLLKDLQEPQEGGEPESGFQAQEAQEAEEPEQQESGNVAPGAGVQAAAKGGRVGLGLEDIPLSNLIPQTDFRGHIKNRWMDIKPAPEGTDPSLIQLTGAAKTSGFFGPIPMLEKGENEMTEVSSGGGDEALIPSLVPSFTPDEIVNVSERMTAGKRYTDQMYEKMDKFAFEREAAGKPHFIAPDEKPKELHPGFLQMMKSRRGQ